MLEILEIIVFALLKIAILPLFFIGVFIVCFCEMLANVFRKCGNFLGAEMET